MKLVRLWKGNKLFQRAKIGMEFLEKMRLFRWYAWIGFVWNLKEFFLVDEIEFRERMSPQVGRLPIAIKRIGWWFWKDSREGLRKLRRGNMAFWRGAWPNFLGRLHDFLRKSMTRFFRGGNVAFWRGAWPDFLGRLHDFLRKNMSRFFKGGNMAFWRGAWPDFLGRLHDFLKRNMIGFF